jgi:hypothetical protein
MGIIMLGGDPLPQEADVHCIACDGDLFFLPDCYPLTFHCENGHFLTIRDLLDEFLPLGKTPNAPALEFWERSARLLHQLAGRALEQRHALNAADFKESADRIDQWTRQLRMLLPGTAPPGRAPPEASGPGAGDLPPSHRNPTRELL